MALPLSALQNNYNLTTVKQGQNRCDVVQPFT